MAFSMLKYILFMSTVESFKLQMDVNFHLFSSVKIIFSFTLLKYFLFCETFHYFITPTGFYFFPLFVTL